MQKWIVLIALGALAGTSFAQKAPLMAPDGAQPPAEPDKKPKDEKTGKDETLQNGGIERPWAQGVAKAEQAAALKVFHDGNQLLNDGLFAKAVDKYREALKHWNHPAIHYNLALALMNLDQSIDAYEHLQASIKFGEAPLQSKDKFDNAKLYILRLEKEIADVEVSCDKPGAKVSLDGKELFVAPGHYKTRVPVGKHQFLAEKQGYTTRITAPYISPGEHFSIDLKLYTADELTRYHRKWDATWIPLAVLGGAVVIGAGGGVLEYSASQSYKDYDNKVKSCSQSAVCQNSASLKSLRDDGDTKRTLGFVGYGLAGATAVAAGVLWYLNRPESYEVRPEDLGGGPDEQATVTPVVAPGYAGAAIQGHF
ncbi:MAG TPA: PEGA domain-containing protein [Kofleriaceae bacterium]|jgi:tetratricopeptide (TPR) repeat protein